MKLLDRKSSSSWKHPLPISLLRKYNHAKSIEDVIELEAATLLSGLAREQGGSFSLSASAVPVEAIAAALKISIVGSACSSPFSATVRQTTKGYQSFQRSSDHYYRQRFSLAHEIGHVVLSQRAGPFSIRVLQDTKGRRHEEEAICDLFASALLIPKPVFETRLGRSTMLSARDVNVLAAEFKVSKGAVLRRIASLKRQILILWDYRQNPLQKKSQRAERIVQVYPFVSQLSSYFIPLYCTLNSSRFSPNIVLESFQSGRSVSGSVRITNLGSIAGGEFVVHNIPFQRWNEDTLEPDIVTKPKHFFNMATFIQA